KHAQRHARENHRQMRPVASHLTTRCLVSGGGAMNLVGLAWQPHRAPVVRHPARHVERCIPEGIPLIFLEDLLRDLLDAVLLESFLCLSIYPPPTGGDTEFGSDVGGESAPRASLSARGQLCNRRRAVVDDEAEPQLLIAVTIPREHERIAVHRGVEAGEALI